MIDIPLKIGHYFVAVEAEVQNPDVAAEGSNTDKASVAASDVGSMG